MKKNKAVFWVFGQIFITYTIQYSNTVHDTVCTYYLCIKFSVDLMMSMKVSSWFASIYMLMNIEAMSNGASISFMMKIVSYS